MIILIQLIQVAANVLMIVVLVHVVLSYFMAPYHPLRQSLDALVEPMLAPIRRVMPRTGMLDFSPLILLILIQVIRSVLVQLLTALV